MTKELTLPARWTVWESFSDTIFELAKDDEAAAKDLLFAMWRYASWGEEPDFGDNCYLKAAFNGSRFNLDASVKACASGKKGGQKKAENSRKEKDMTNEESKRLKKLSKAMGNVYEATVVPEFEDDEDVIPDWMYENQAAFMSDDYERRRSLLQDEIDAYEMLG